MCDEHLPGQMCMLYKHTHKHIHAHTKMHACACTVHLGSRKGNGLISVTKAAPCDPTVGLVELLRGEPVGEANSVLILELQYLASMVRWDLSSNASDLSSDAFCIHGQVGGLKSGPNSGGAIRSMGAALGKLHIGPSWGGSKNGGQVGAGKELERPLSRAQRALWLYFPRDLVPGVPLFARRSTREINSNKLIPACRCFGATTQFPLQALIGIGMSAWHCSGMNVC